MGSVTLVIDTSSQRKFAVVKLFDIEYLILIPGYKFEQAFELISMLNGQEISLRNGQYRMVSDSSYFDAVSALHSQHSFPQDKYVAYDNIDGHYRIKHSSTKRHVTVMSLKWHLNKYFPNLVSDQGCLELMRLQQTEDKSIHDWENYWEKVLDRGFILRLMIHKKHNEVLFVCVEDLVAEMQQFEQFNEELKKRTVSCLS